MLQRQPFILRENVRRNHSSCFYFSNTLVQKFDVQFLIEWLVLCWIRFDYFWWIDDFRYVCGLRNFRDNEGSEKIPFSIKKSPFSFFLVPKILSLNGVWITQLGLFYAIFSIIIAVSHWLEIKKIFKLWVM